MSSRTNQRLAMAHRTCVAPQRLCRLLMLALPWQRTESVGSCVSEWRRRWRRALPETARPVCIPQPLTRASFPAAVRADEREPLASDCMFSPRCLCARRRRLGAVAFTPMLTGSGM